METTPTTENAAWFDARTVTNHLDVVDRQAASIVDTRTGGGSTVRFFNAAEGEFMKLRTDLVSKRFQPLFDEKLKGVRHAEDGRLYAILAGPDEDPYEEPMDVVSFVDVQVGLEAVTVSLMAPFAEMGQATRPYMDSEMDGLL